MTIISVPAEQHGFWNNLATWPGWDMTGALAGVLAALVIIPAVIRYFRERYKPNVGFLELNTYGHRIVNGRKIYLADLSNGGGAAVSIFSVGYVKANGAWAEVSEQPRWWLGVGDSITLPFEAVNEQDAWALIMYVSMEDMRFMRTTWRPLFVASEAEKAYRISSDEWKPIRWWQPWKLLKRRKITAVGPGGSWSERVKGGAKLQDHEKVLEIFAAQGGLTTRAGARAEPRKP